MYSYLLADLLISPDCWFSILFQYGLVIFQVSQKYECGFNFLVDLSELTFFIAISLKDWAHILLFFQLILHILGELIDNIWKGPKTIKVNLF